MIALNIALTFNKNINAYFYDKQKHINDSKFYFDKNHVPHLTLLQFYCREKDVFQVNDIVNDININIDNLCLYFNKNKINNNDYIYSFITTNNHDLSELNKKIKVLFNEFIRSPDMNLNNLFWENITFDNLKNVVLNYKDAQYNPHITMGISSENIDLNLEQIKIEKNNIKITLNKIGDFGTAIPLSNPFFYCHRINTSEELENIPTNYGIELDLRDKDNDLILVHDPHKNGENFENFLKNYNKSSIILNIKSERIEYKVIDILKKYNINDYFFLDSSFPMIYQLNKINEKNIAIRFSEYESIESVMLVKNMVKWVWVDCFSYFPLNKEIYAKIKNENLKICLVSPELQGHDVNKINEFVEIINKNKFVIDAICTKIYNIDKWKII